MDDGGNPYIFIMIMMGAVIVVLAMALIMVIMRFRDTIKKQLLKSAKGEQKSAEEEVQEEIISMLNEGHEQGVFLGNEAEMIQNIFDFSDKEAKDIMTHRKNIVALDGKLSFHDAIDVMIENAYSRYPVYIDDIDNIIGVVHIKDALLFSKRNEVFRTSICDIPDFVRQVEFIPETRNIHALFQVMQSQKQHMVIVVDEYGQTSGVVAMEDILEEIVGNIEDEHDKEQAFVEEVEKGVFLLDGEAPFEEVVEQLELPLDEDAFDTLNGYLISKLEKIPGDDDEFVVQADGYEFRILHVENKTIRNVKARVLADTCHSME